LALVSFLSAMIPGRLSKSSLIEFDKALARPLGTRLLM
jgi:hypothetical protein